MHAYLGVTVESGIESVAVGCPEVQPPESIKILPEEERTLLGVTWRLEMNIYNFSTIWLFNIAMETIYKWAIYTMAMLNNQTVFFVVTSKENRKVRILIHRMLLFYFSWGCYISNRD